MRTEHPMLEAWYDCLTRVNFFPRVRPRRNPPRLNITLTTVPERFPRVHIALASLLCQRLKPDRILLWVGNRKGGRHPDLPRAVLGLRRRGLDIRIRDDLGPHTKLLYALREFPDDINVAADDDRIYPRGWLGGLYNSYLGDPQAIHCYRAHGMRYDRHGRLRSYNDWHLLSPGETGPSMALFPTGTGGVLYPPRCLPQEVFNLETMRHLCPRADDVWFKAMSMLTGVRVRKVFAQFREFHSVSGTQTERLWNRNALGNDAQIEGVFKHYDLY